MLNIHINQVYIVCHKSNNQKYLVYSYIFRNMLLIKFIAQPKSKWNFPRT